MLRRSNMHSQNVTDRHDEVRPEAKRRRKDPPEDEVNTMHAGSEEEFAFRMGGGRRRSKIRKRSEQVWR